MALVRCPSCGRVADGRNCFACGYSWPANAASSTPPQPAPPASVPPRAASPFSRPASTPGPGANPFQPPPRLPTPAPAAGLGFVSPPVASPAGAPQAPFAPFASPAAPPGFPAMGAPSLARAPTPMPSASPFSRAPITNPFASPPRAPTPQPRIPSPASAAPGPAAVSGVFNSPFAQVGAPAPVMDAGDMPMIVVPPPAAVLGAPPKPELPGLSALFDDIPRSDPSIPIPRATPTPAAASPGAGFDVDIDLGDAGGADAVPGFAGVSVVVGGSGNDDPTIDGVAAGLPAVDVDMGEGAGQGTADGAEQPLGASLVAAFEHNRTAPVEVGQVLEVASTTFSIETEQSTMSMPSPIVVRLRDLQQRLVREGRAADGEIIAQALSLLESGGA